jgi:hypothetical protein
LSTLPKVTLKASSPIPNSNTYRAVIRTLGRLTRYADLVNLWCDLRVTSWYPYESFISQNFLHALVETSPYLHSLTQSLNHSITLSLSLSLSLQNISS